MTKVFRCLSAPVRLAADNVRRAESCEGKKGSPCGLLTSRRPCEMEYDPVTS